MRGVSYLRVDLFAVYGDASVRLDSYSDLLAVYAEHRDRDVLRVPHAWRAQERFEVLC